ncbi:MAG: Mur ligase family protein [Bdellovibrionota bacterium]
MKLEIGGEPAIEKVRRFLDHTVGRKLKPRVIQVVGTNGKGSVVMDITAALISAGYTVGSTISPHLLEMNERCLINGQRLDDLTLGTYAYRVYEISKELNLELAFPVAILASSLLIFQELDLDFIVLETGLGGAMDGATAIESPEVIVLTTIGRDHEHVLGEYPLGIASQKLGAVRDGAKVVLGRIETGTRSFLLEEIKKLKSKVTSIGFDFDYKKESGFKYLTGTPIDFTLSSGKTINSKLLFEGQHQADNLAVALEVISQLKIPLDEIVLDINHLNWQGRLERFYFNSREWILDCAHNEEAMAVVSQHLAKLDNRKYLICYSGMGKRDWQKILAYLRPIASEFIFHQLDYFRAADMNMISSNLSGIEISTEVHSGSYRELIEKISNRDNNQPVLVIGSLYLVGSFRQALLEKFNK